MSSDLRHVLDAYTSGSLIAMASFHGLAKKGPKAKQQAVADLSQALVQQDRILSTWNDLSRAERAAVEAILQRGGEALTHTLRQVLTRQGLIRVEKPQPRSFGLDIPKPIDPRATSSRRLEDILARLTLRGVMLCAWL